MRHADYIPPAPSPRIVKPNARPSLKGYATYFQIMSNNPLEIWTEQHFNEPVILTKVLGYHYALVHDPEAIHRYLVTNADNYRLPAIRRLLFERVIGNGLLVSEGERWKKTRKALMPIFTPRHIFGFAEKMHAVAMRRADELQARHGEKICMSQEMIDLTLAILVEVLFSKDTDLNLEQFSTDMDRALKISGTPHAFDLMHMPQWFPRLGRGETNRLIKGMRSHLADVASTRRKKISQSNSPSSDFLTLLLEAGKDTGEGLDDEGVVDNLITFIAAGHETTARSLIWVFYLLSQSDEWRVRVEREIDAAPLADTPPEKWPSLLPELVAVIKETMRLYPAGSMFSRSAIEADTLSGHAVQAGTIAVTSAWVLHRHRKLWPSPDVFDPERFMGERAESIPKYAYLPFGAGPRVCIGASFAMQEMVIILAVFLSRLGFEFAGKEDPVPVMRITIQPESSVEMTVSARGP